MECCDFSPRFTTLHFLCDLMCRPNKLEFYITLGWKGLPIINTVAYWALSKVMKKVKSCEYSPLGQCYKSFSVDNLLILVVS
jgi:hypothetical protein